MIEVLAAGAQATVQDLGRTDCLRWGVGTAGAMDPMALAAGTGAVKLSGATTRDLLATRGREELAELHWRIFFPLMALVLAGIAIPLAKLQPRQGRYARMGYAVLIFFVYINPAIAVSTRGARQGLVPTPPSATRAWRMRPPSMSSATAAETTANSNDARSRTLR